MEPITLTVANELAALPVLQAVAAAFLRAAGAENSLYCQIELVLEEIFTNILDHEYLPGQREQIHLTLGIDGRNLALTMRFKGIPFDVDYLQQCAESDPKDMPGDDLQGIGLRLIREFSDQIEYRNLGKEGQEIYLLRKISAERAFPPEPVSSQEVGEQVSQPFDICIRHMLPAEAAKVSKLAYFSLRLLL